MGSQGRGLTSSIFQKKNSFIPAAHLSHLLKNRKRVNNASGVIHRLAGRVIGIVKCVTFSKFYPLLKTGVQYVFPTFEVKHSISY